MIRFAQYLVMAASGCGIIYWGQVTNTYINPYILGLGSIVPAYVLTWAVCKLLDWHLARRDAAAFAREQQTREFFWVERE
jgi:hypothetical protein